MDWPSEVLPTPGGPTKQRIGPFICLLSLRTPKVLEDAVLHFFEVVVVLIQDSFRVLYVQFVPGALWTRAVRRSNQDRSG